MYELNVKCKSKAWHMETIDVTHFPEKVENLKLFQ